MEQVECLKALNYRNVKPGTYLAKYLPPVEDLDRTKNGVELRRQKMNNPDAPRRLHREIEKLQQDMRTWQEGLSEAHDDTVKLLYYNKIMQAQHTLELRKDNLVHVEDGNYHLR